MPEESGEITAEQLLAAAEQHDAVTDAGETPVVEIETPETETEETPEEPKVEEAEAEPETDEQDVDKPDSSLTESEAPETEEQPKSKWAKNEARKSKSWKEINSKKEEIKREREELEKLRGELSEARDDLNEGQEYRDEKGFTAGDYESAAERLESSGDHDVAKNARERASKVRAEADKAGESRAVKEAQAKWDETRADLMRETPELKDTESELTKTANQILKDHPDLMYVPEGRGLRHAVQIAEYKIKAAQSESSQAEVKELTEKLTKLEKKMSISGGFTNDRPDGERAFEDLSEEEQESHLRKAAMSLDDSL
jgi:hypothetical protein